jgi:hypothetical protein
MTDRLSDTFGAILIGVAVLLAVWEQIAYSHRGTESWLVTKRRYRRRLLVSVVLAVVGTLIVLESRRLIDIHRVPMLMVYVFSLTGLSLVLLILAVVDVTDTARNAARHSLSVLAKTVGEKRVAESASNEQPAGD